MIDVAVTSDDGKVRNQRIAGSGPLTMGRDESCTVRVASDVVSRQHAVVTLRASGMHVRDVSSNGTIVGDRVLRKESVEVPFGTTIRLADHTVIIVPVEDSADVRLDRTPVPVADSPVARSPALASPAAREIRRDIHRQLLDYLDLAKVDASTLEDPSMRPKVLLALRRIIANLDDRIPPEVHRDVLLGELADEALGLGPLERFLADPTIDEIMVVDASTIYVETQGKLVKTDAYFTDDERVRAVIERIVTPLGRRINAIIRPLAIKGSCITIRKFARKPLAMQDLVSYGGLTDRMAHFLERCVIAKKNIVISGGTGSGKTTLLNVLSACIPSKERIVTIEDAAELQLAQPHVVSLETRPANMEGKGQYSIRDLVKNALRMRPDRIVVGECRGGEALDMLQAMNTGHDGSLTTTHANSTLEALGRLETLALMSGVELPARAIREQIVGSIDVIVQQARFADGSRRITEIAEVVGLGDDGEFEMRPLFHFVRSGHGPKGEVSGSFRSTGYLPSFLPQFIVLGLVKHGEAYL
jgi:pilus assembly protein CpaF